MEAMVEAAIWFWLPLILVPIGFWLAISGRGEKGGKILAGLGLILVMASPWTVPSSDSTAAGHLLLAILGPTLLLAYGLHGMIFGGEVPVGKLDKSARWSGALAVAASISFLGMMHWSTFTPIWRGQVNPYWMVFWPTFLMFGTSLCSAAGVALTGFGDDRNKEATNLILASIILAAIALAAMFIDGSNTSAGEFRNHLWSAAADILGTVAGAGAAIATFAIVIWAYERSLPDPENSPPPSDEEIKHVVSLADAHLDGGEEE
jgi:hypothetical protein